MPSSEINHPDYECPLCYNNAVPCGCYSKADIINILCGPISATSVRLAMGIAEGRNSDIPPCENMLFVQPGSVRSVNSFGDMIRKVNIFDEVCVLGRFHEIHVRQVPKLVPCALSRKEDNQKADVLFGISQENLQSIFCTQMQKQSAEEDQRIFAQRYGGRTKEEVEKHGTLGQY